DRAREPRGPRDGVSRLLGGDRRAEQREGVEEEHPVAALHVLLQIVGGAAERQARIFPILDRLPVEVEALASTENFHRPSCGAGTEQLWCQLHPVGGPAGKREAGQETLGMVRPPPAGPPTGSCCHRFRRSERSPRVGSRVSPSTGAVRRGMRNEKRRFLGAFNGSRKLGGAGRPALRLSAPRRLWTPPQPSTRPW